MSELILSAMLPRRQGPVVELSAEERATLITILDLLIPADGDFPPPSSLHLIDEFLRYLRAEAFRYPSLSLSLPRLRAVLRDLNLAADGNFCKASPELQQTILWQLEQRDPAFFQALWTLANHSYYARLAMRGRASAPAPLSAPASAPAPAAER
ncbi:MAG: hypothetical protein IRZ31_07340 [Thermogemmatispora sp.]|uniref:Gluconate 2-dehydrogenase subunit 3 family protein n=1 Tax=Thermogemmatispora tikiterensis TaxID=1825093 RepID=A0A328VRG5_9CHLR|nr:MULTISPECIES: hypothetical protein [Thermogemmatispora]MBX5456700.1 hypothetical protein [Thermogemmatispora sp.]RAQ98330.1 hypothetical protein A4R35_22510 [Thermogemmatispora tikiterensis]